MSESARSPEDKVREVQVELARAFLDDIISPYATDDEVIEGGGWKFYRLAVTLVKLHD